MFDLDSVTFDPASGRPIAPMAWRAFPFWVVVSLVMAVLLFALTVMSLQDGEMLWAGASSLTLVFVIAFTEWRRRQIKRRRLLFQKELENYERLLRKPLHF
jgi:hypothetical protein